MSAQGDPLSGVLVDLALVGAAVRGAHRQIVDGASPGPQLALALAAGERAQQELLSLLREALRSGRAGSLGRRVRSRRGTARAGRARCASGRPRRRGP